MICRTPEEIRAAAQAAAAELPALTRDQARRLAAILAPYLAQRASA